MCGRRDQRWKTSPTEEDEEAWRENGENKRQKKENAQEIFSVT
jgi:hypothetical protein